MIHHATILSAGHDAISADVNGVLCMYGAVECRTKDSVMLISMEYDSLMADDTLPSCRAQLNIVGV